MKKNTLLYLDNEIVTKAKQHNLNLSQITEDAIKSHLFPMLSLGEKAETDYWEYLNGLNKERYAFFLPVMIKQAKLTNVGPIKNITLNFDRFNLILGKNATGKTTIIRSIAYVFGHEFVKGYFSDKAAIELEIRPEKKYKLRISSANDKENIKCILIDCGGSRFDRHHFEKFLIYLNKLGIQIIMTEHGLREGISYDNIKIIKLPDASNKKNYKTVRV